MSKMSKLWYEARDATDSGKYKETRTCILREYLAELSIVQPWESDPKCFGAVDKKNGMKNKLKEEIERRKQRDLARLRKFLWTVLVGVLVGAVVVVIEHVLFPDNRQPDIKESTPAAHTAEDPITKTSNQKNQSTGKKD